MYNFAPFNDTIFEITYKLKIGNKTKTRFRFIDSGEMTLENVYYARETLDVCIQACLPALSIDIARENEHLCLRTAEVAKGRWTGIRSNIKALPEF